MKFYDPTVTKNSNREGLEGFVNFMYTDKLSVVHLSASDPRSRENQNPSKEKLLEQKEEKKASIAQMDEELEKKRAEQEKKTSSQPEMLPPRFGKWQGEESDAINPEGKDQNAENLSDVLDPAEREKDPYVDQLADDIDVPLIDQEMNDTSCSLCFFRR